MQFFDEGGKVITPMATAIPQQFSGVAPDRIMQFLTDRGARVYAVTDGMVYADSDVSNALLADPSQPTAAEAAAKTLRQQVVDGLTTLIADEAILKGPPAPTAAQVRDATLHVNQGLQKLVKLLIDNGTLGSGG